MAQQGVQLVGIRAIEESPGSELDFRRTGLIIQTINWPRGASGNQDIVSCDRPVIEAWTDVVIPSSIASPGHMRPEARCLARLYGITTGRIVREISGGNARVSAESREKSEDRRQPFRPMMQADISIAIGLRIIGEGECKEEESHAGNSGPDNDLSEPANRRTECCSFLNASQRSRDGECNRADRDAALDGFLSLLLVLKHIQRDLIAQHWKQFAVYVELIPNAAQLDRTSSLEKVEQVRGKDSVADPLILPRELSLARRGDEKARVTFTEPAKETHPPSDTFGVAAIEN